MEKLESLVARREESARNGGNLLCSAQEVVNTNLSANSRTNYEYRFSLCDERERSAE